MKKIKQKKEGNPKYIKQIMRNYINAIQDKQKEILELGKKKSI